jgi:hypothetical protein
VVTPFLFPPTAEGFEEDDAGDEALAIDPCEGEAGIEDGAVGIDDFEIAGEAFVITQPRES